MEKELFRAIRLKMKGEKKSGKTHDGMSQTEFAKYTGLKVTQVRNIEAGSIPVPPMFEKLCKVDNRLMWAKFAVAGGNDE